MGNYIATSKANTSISGIYLKISFIITSLKDRHGEYIIRLITEVAQKDINAGKTLKMLFLKYFTSDFETRTLKNSYTQEMIQKITDIKL